MTILIDFVMFYSYKQNSLANVGQMLIRIRLVHCTLFSQGRQEHHIDVNDTKKHRHRSNEAIFYMMEMVET